MTMTLEQVAEQANAVLDEVEKAVIGKRHVLELLMLGILADGHVLIEDFPGLAKTLMARSFAAVMGLSFARVQFTPDLMPADITGSSIFDQGRAVFEFKPGPIFANLVLGDEINRAPPKTQSALLEAMQERQVTSEGVTRPLERPFIVLATQNPIEYEGTYPLPEAQLDRFLLRLSLGYPALDDERAIVAARLERRSDDVTLEVRCGARDLSDMQQSIETVYVASVLIEYAVAIVGATRESTRVQVGASPRGTLALVKLARGLAALHGRDYVTPDDIKHVAVPALEHRLTLKPELWVQQVPAARIVEECLATVPTPAARDLSARP